MKDKLIFIAVLLFFIIVSFFTDLWQQSDVKVYNCSISEISPDYPIEVKEECRKLRRDQYNENTRTISI